MTEADSVYINYDPFEGDRDVEISLRSVKIVTTRKQQQCMRPEGGIHAIEPGTKARYEKALVDGDYWGRYYTCVECMDRWLASVGIRNERNTHHRPDRVS